MSTPKYSDITKQLMWDWYDQKFGSKKPYALMWSWQKLFNQLNPTRCRGMEFMKDINRGRQSCNHPMCPTCWHRRQAVFLETLQNALFGRFYARSIGPYLWSVDPPDDALKRLLYRSTRFKLLGWSLCLDAADKVITPEIQRMDSFAGEMFYYVRGLFSASRSIRAYGAVSQGSFRFSDDLVVEELPEAENPAHWWLDQLRHPMEFKSHSIFSEYLERFNAGLPTGRAWIRINHGQYHVNNI